MGASEATIERLDKEMLNCWAKKMDFKGAAKDTYVIFAEYKSDYGRKAMYAHAKMMNAMCRKYQVEMRRIMLHVIPQLEARFAVLNKVSYMLREDFEAKGIRIHTRMEFESNTIVLQMKQLDLNDYHQTVDVSKFYPDLTVPGIKYELIDYKEAQPSRFSFQGLKSPPGRNRNNVPIRHPGSNPPRQSLSNPATNANREPLGIQNWIRDCLSHGSCRGQVGIGEAWRQLC